LHADDFSFDFLSGAFQFINLFQFYLLFFPSLLYCIFNLYIFLFLFLPFCFYSFFPASPQKSFNETSFTS